jgi:hypothetical protein
MKALSDHYEFTRTKYPKGKLAIVFDIDNTILDMRYMIVRVLKEYDQQHGSAYFSDLQDSHLDINENQVQDYLERYDMPAAERAAIAEWYVNRRWSREAILGAHRPFTGVMEVIRWFQMQPNTVIALNTGRPAEIREDTLRSLNIIGAEYKVSFDGAFLHMNPGGWEADVRGSKVDGVRVLQDQGYRVFAVVDNEPANLEVMEEANDDGSILMLHADTIFDSKRSALPQASVSGAEYDLTDLIPEEALPEHIQFVWHGVNDEPNLLQFLTSDVQWAECDVRFRGDTMVLRHDNFDEHPLDDGEELLTLEEVVANTRSAGKSIKLDLKDEALIDSLIPLLRSCGMTDKDVWFSANIEDVSESGFRRLAREFPQATLQCSVDFVAPLVMESPHEARKTLEQFRSWGINRVSLGWGLDGLSAVLERLDSWGFQVNIWNVPDLEAFLKAALLLPRSITSDFNFPKWKYYGRGAGKRGRYHEYTPGDDGTD